MQKNKKFGKLSGSSGSAALHLLLHIYPSLIQIAKKIQIFFHVQMQPLYLR